MATIFELIRRDHAAIRSLLRETQEASSSEATVECQGRLSRALRIHEEAEHCSLYSAMLSKERGEELGAQAAGAHRRIEQALDDLIATPAGTVEHDVRLQELKNCIEHHLRWEQERLFPAAHFLFGANTIQQLGNVYEHAREEAQSLAA